MVPKYSGWWQRAPSSRERAPSDAPNINAADASAERMPPSPYNWTNSHGGPLVRGGDPTSRFHHRVNAPPHALTAFAPSSTAPHYNYSYVATRLVAGDDLAILTVSSALQAQLACSARVLCRGVTYNASGVNGTIPRPTTAYLKSAAAFLCNSREQSGCGAPWSAWLKTAPPPPDI